MPQLPKLERYLPLMMITKKMDNIEAIFEI